MPSTALAVAAAQPLTCAVAALCVGVYAWMWNTRRDRDLAHVATSYARVVLQRQWYRAVTATFCHVNALHLLFNMGSLMSMGVAEVMLGPLGYVRVTILLMLLSEALFLGITHAVVKRAPAPIAARWRDASAVGYSGVIFGWMTLLSVSQPGAAIPLPGGYALPFSMAPFVSLVVNQLLVPQASMLGHFAGILAGYALAWGLLRWADGYWFWSSLVYVTGAFLLSLRANPACPAWLRRWVDVSPEFAAGITGPAPGADGSAVASQRRYMAGGRLRVVNVDASGVLQLVDPDDGSSGAAAASAGATAPRAPSQAPPPPPGRAAALLAGLRGLLPWRRPSQPAATPAPDAAQSSAARGTPPVTDATVINVPSPQQAAAGAAAGAPTPAAGAGARPAAAAPPGAASPSTPGAPAKRGGARTAPTPTATTTSLTNTTAARHRRHSVASRGDSEEEDGDGANGAGDGSAAERRRLVI